MMPHRLIRPIVGLMPASIVALLGMITEPCVSVPTLAAQKLAAAPAPELDPPVPSAGRPSNVSVARVHSRIVRVVRVLPTPL